MTAILKKIIINHLAQLWPRYINTNIPNVSKKRIVLGSIFSILNPVLLKYINVTIADKEQHANAVTNTNHFPYIIFLSI